MKKKLAVFLAAILVLDVVAVGVIFFTRNSSGGLGIGVNAPGQVVEVTKGQAGEEFSSVSFVAVGDNLIHKDIYEQASARAGDGGYDFAPDYENVADLIAAPDVAILNQETIISTEHNVDTYPCFNSPAELGDEMCDIGFDIFNIATNHSLDKGEKGLLSAIDYWNGKGKITTGAYKDENDFQQIRTNTVNGVTMAYIGFTEQTNGLTLPEDSNVVLVEAADEARIKEWITRANEVADVVVVNAHWGVEYTHEPTDGQRDLAAKLASWGADVVIGTHPHVIQPVEFIDNADGSRTLVAYSLGNFISAQNRGARMLGGMLNFNVIKNNNTGDIQIKDVKFSGVVTHYGYGFANIRVYPLSTYTDDLASKHGVLSHTSDFSVEYLNEIVNDVIDKQFLIS